MFSSFKTSFFGRFPLFLSQGKATVPRHGAVPWHSDHRGLTALHWACALGFGRREGDLSVVLVGYPLVNVNIYRWVEFPEANKIAPARPEKHWGLHGNAWNMRIFQWRWMDLWALGVGVFHGFSTAERLCKLLLMVPLNAEVGMVGMMAAKVNPTSFWLPRAPQFNGPLSRIQAHWSLFCIGKISDMDWYRTMSHQDRHDLHLTKDSHSLRHFFLIM